MCSMLCHAILQQVSVQKSRGLKYMHLKWIKHEQRLPNAYILKLFICFYLSTQNFRHSVLRGQERRAEQSRL